MIFVSRTLEAAQSYVEELGALGTAAETVDAIKQADIVVLSVWFNTIQEFMTEYAAEFDGENCYRSIQPYCSR